MICLAGNLPPLKVGRQKVVGYETDWIEQALHRAAHAGGHQDCPFLKDISRGVLHYLEKHSSLQLFPIETLYDRMRGMLRKIGCPEIADHLSPLAPPVTVSLVGPARQAGPGSLKTFFHILNEEILLLHHSGAELIHFRDVDESIRFLGGNADRLRCKIRAFFEDQDHRISVPHRRLQLTLES
ncbi:MAG: hypothetical protein ACON4R_05445 [Akkermansiaceae bacterium]